MRLKRISIKNFRCYREEITVWFDDLTTFIGKNDIGKSSVLEALEIFFNNEIVKIESGDANVYSHDKKVSITCEFAELPSSLTLDAAAASRSCRCQSPALATGPPMGCPYAIRRRCR